MTNKLSLTGREKNITFFLFGLISVFIIYRYGAVPLKERIGKLEQKIDLTEGRLRKNVKVIGKSRDFEQKYRHILTDYEQKVSDEETMTGILSQIEAVGSQINIRLADLKPQKVRKIDLYNRFPVSLTVEGNIPDIMLFVYTLQNSPYEFYVEEFQLRKKSAMAEESECNLVLAKILIP